MARTLLEAPLELHPSPERAQAARALLDLLASQPDALDGAGGVDNDVVRFVREVLALAAESRAVAVIADDVEVTPSQAAQLLNVSRPTVRRALEGGTLAGRLVRGQRWVRFTDLLDFHRRATHDQRRLVGAVFGAPEPLPPADR